MLTAEGPFAGFDIEANHTILAEDFTERYIRKAGIPLLARAARYDPDKPVCDYTKTWWEAQPNSHSEGVADWVLARIMGRTRGTMDGLYAMMDEVAEPVEQALHDYPVMIIAGHSPDLLTAIPAYGLNKAIARRQSGDYTENLSEMIRLSHPIATRGLAPIELKIPIPGIAKADRNILRAAQLIFNAHFTFPRTKQMMSSGIDTKFIAAYNHLARDDQLEVIRRPSEHPLGLRQLWAMAPNAGPDQKGQGEHEGKLITQKVSEATIRHVGSMGCGLLLVTAMLKGKKGDIIVRPGKLIPPDRVTLDTLPSLAEIQAWSRRKHGEENVYYAEELS